MRKGCLALALALALPCAGLAYYPIDPGPIGFPEFSFDNVSVTYGAGYGLSVGGPVYSVETDSGVTYIEDGLLAIEIFYVGSSFDGDLVVGFFQGGTLTIWGDAGGGYETLLSGYFGEADALTIYGQNGYTYGAMTAVYTVSYLSPTLDGGGEALDDGLALPGGLVSVVFNLLPPPGGEPLVFGDGLFRMNFAAEAKGTTGPIVPEPGTVALLGAGLGLLGLRCGGKGQEG